MALVLSILPDTPVNNTDESSRGSANSDDLSLHFYSWSPFFDKDEWKKTIKNTSLFFKRVR